MNYQCIYDMIKEYNDPPKISQLSTCITWFPFWSFTNSSTLPSSFCKDRLCMTDIFTISIKACCDPKILFNCSEIGRTVDKFHIFMNKYISSFMNLEIYISESDLHNCSLFLLTHCLQGFLYHPETIKLYV